MKFGRMQVVIHGSLTYFKFPDINFMDLFEYGADAASAVSGPSLGSSALRGEPGRRTDGQAPHSSDAKRRTNIVLAVTRSTANTQTPCTSPSCLLLTTNGLCLYVDA